MPRMLIGSFAAAIAMFVTGFIFFATPLSYLAYGSADVQQQATVQQVLAANLKQTGTYTIPSAATAAGAVMYGKGPIATIHYNSGGFGVADPAVLISGFVHELIVALLMGFALLTVAARVPDFVSRAKLVVLFSVAGGVLAHLGEPIWYHHDWGHFIYLFVGDTAMLVVGGLIIARWFLPRAEPGVSA
ncbi:hypothetical protein [Sphingomonas colocasiae]|uniref:DUF4386 domain-containing protein n=1 Tax=Sphingomonas colocasiae TaxID=1848973 RepID=A0ABS7PU26_9SPHN|nr:hypothetical protein [Sphingomonas colocasiae]MBY8824844.1 hypothetical protein [Sphingomonas colocasiae]